MNFFRRKSQEQSQSHQQWDNSDIFRSINGTFNTLNSVCVKSVRTVNEMATNLAYNARHSNLPIIQRKPIQLTKFGSPAVLLAQSFQYGQQKQFQQKFHQIIWFSYRSQKDGRVSDAGWGCMIRVCQMMLAEALKQIYPKKHKSQIVNQFSENSDSLFSFDQICNAGKIQKRWTSSTQILSILQNLLEHQHKFTISIQIYNSTVSLQDSQDSNLKYPMIVAINNRVGENSIPKQYHDSFFALMDHKFTLGVLGGIGGEAVYIVGYQNKNLIVMDPHYIQTQNDGESIHFKNTPRGVPIQKLVPTISFCFLLKNKKEHEEWIQDIGEISYFHDPYPCIQFDYESGKKIYEQRHESEKRSDDEEFQILE